MDNTLYPQDSSLDSSLAKEIRRLFFEPHRSLDYSGRVPTARDDFKLNGRDSEYCPELETPRNYVVGGAGYGVGYGVGVLGGRGGYGGVFIPRYVSHPSVQETQELIKKAIISGQANVSCSTSSNPSSSDLVGGATVSRVGVAGGGRRGECVFCRNNGEERRLYQSHLLKDKNGKVTCPVLRVYICPICGSTGDNSHTLRYCPLNKHKNAGPNLANLRLARTSTGLRSIQRPL